MDRTNKDAVAKKSKSERLGWENYSTRIATDMRTIIGDGNKVEKNTYCNSSANYRKLVP